VNTEARTLLLRADGGLQIGTGHLMRCLALAQAWQDSGGQAVLLTSEEASGLDGRFLKERVRVEWVAGQPASPEDARQTADCARRLESDWIVLDGYRFPGRYQKLIKEAGFRLLALDDYGHAECYAADLVLNQNLHAEERLYAHREAYTRLLLGPRFALLRREFVRRIGWRREIPEVARKILVTLGGSDPDNVTLRVVQALRQMRLEGLEAVILVGAANPHRDELEAAVRSAPALRLQVNAPDMPELLAWADVAVAAGGTTTWELAFMGLPALILVLADNQRDVARGLEAAGVAGNLGCFESVTPEQIAGELSELLTDPHRRRQWSCKGQALVDGRGANWVVQRLSSRPLHLRRVRPEDCRQVWEWSNDATVRAVSFCPQPIPWQGHVEWFRNKLADPRCLYFVASDETGQPIGQARCDVTGEEGILSISLAAPFRGQGYGQALLRAAAREVFAVTGAVCLHAYVKPGNEVSARAFREAGFAGAEVARIQGQEAFHFILRKQGL
jgi:UDP-2,4-diacetamido-2,4,6-trideoxy-beta-L-altropyranose hydrolase